MKKLISILALMVYTFTAFAQQKDVTTFLGIPVDGTKAEMRRQLIAKGFTPAQTSDGTEYFEGEFNGTDVHLFIVTNNNKVYRIFVADAKTQDEANIKIRFNNLIKQFENNQRYISLQDYTISQNENISYEMSVHNKVYDAIFYQKPTISSEYSDTFVNKPVWFRISKNGSRYTIGIYYDNEYNQANGEDL